jgi:hypothetical protein
MTERRGEERRREHSVMLGKPEGKRPSGIFRRRLKDSIKIDLQNLGWGSMDWIDVAQVKDRG